MRVWHTPVAGPRRQWPLASLTTAGPSKNSCRFMSHRRAGHHPSNGRSEEHTSELQSLAYLVCRLLLEKKNDFESRRIIFWNVSQIERSPTFTAKLHRILHYGH